MNKQKEVIKTNKPILLLLWLIKFMPLFFTRLLVYPVSFFFWCFAFGARKNCRNFQKRLRKFTNGKSPVLISTYRQFFNFSLCVVEKIEGWVGKKNFSSIIIQDDCQNLIDHLNSGKGAFIIASHLGNMELMRSLTTMNEMGCKRPVKVTILMEMGATSNFNKTLEKINPNAMTDVIDTNSISPQTIIDLEDKINQGNLVVITGDRFSANGSSQKLVKNFLGDPAAFPYGAFLIPVLLHTPVYFMFGMRSKSFSVFAKNYELYVETAKTELDVPRNKRNETIDALSNEYVDYLQNFASRFPYQWYNFGCFWENGEQ